MLLAVEGDVSKSYYCRTAPSYNDAKPTPKRGMCKGLSVPRMLFLSKQCLCSLTLLVAWVHILKGCAQIEYGHLILIHKSVIKSTTYCLPTNSLICTSSFALFVRFSCCSPIVSACESSTEQLPVQKSGNLSPPVAFTIAQCITVVTACVWIQCSSLLSYTKSLVH